MFRTLAMAGLAVAALAAPAFAHPHVWIEMSSGLKFNAEGAIEGMNIIWVFDDSYAEAALDGLDADADGTYSEAEIEPLTKENMLSLKDYDYFALLRADGKKQPFGEVTQYKQIYSNGKLALQFFLPLAAPIDPRQHKFSAKVFDPEFFIAIDYSQSEPYRVSGTPPQGCAPKLLPLPTEEEMQKTRDYLAEKGQDWKPAEGEEFGEMFAQALVVECSGT